MEAMAFDYFKVLYTVDNQVSPEPLLNLIQPNVTEQMNTNLCKEFTDDEIADALFQIGPIKTPGPDSFPARFFQRNWEVLCRAVRNFFETKSMPQGVNDTAIILIPKRTNRNVKGLLTNQFMQCGIQSGLQVTC